MEKIDQRTRIGSINMAGEKKRSHCFFKKDEEGNIRPQHLALRWGMGGRYGLLQRKHWAEGYGSLRRKSEANPSLRLALLLLSDGTWMTKDRQEKVR